MGVRTKVPSEETLVLPSSLPSASVNIVDQVPERLAQMGAKRLMCVKRFQR